MHKDLIKQYFSNNIRALAKILTIVESRQSGFEEIMTEITNQVRAGKPTYCIGITGPPGAGKSTIVDGLTHILRKDGQKVGIIAIDPSSPFSGGAVLGDRIRMQDHSGDSGVFIRSMGSRSSHGGLSRATRDVVRVMAGFGFDYIIVETVGVGQTELDIMDLADTTAVILVPEAGDTIQTMKAGLLEIADIFVVNKSDRPGADTISQALTGLAEMDSNSKWKIPIVKTEALHRKGIDELLEKIKAHIKYTKNDPDFQLHRKKMLETELIQITLELLERDLGSKLVKDKKFKKILDKVSAGAESPYKSAQKIIEAFYEK